MANESCWWWKYTDWDTSTKTTFDRAEKDKDRLGSWLTEEKAEPAENEARRDEVYGTNPRTWLWHQWLAPDFNYMAVEEKGDFG